MLSPSAGVLGSAVATARDAFSSRGAAFSTYIADISKGIAIILVGGLTCGVVLSLVRPCGCEGGGGWRGVACISAMVWTGGKGALLDMGGACTGGIARKGKGRSSLSVLPVAV